MALTGLTVIILPEVSAAILLFAMHKALEDHSAVRLPELLMRCPA